MISLWYVSLSAFTFLVFVSSFKLEPKSSLALTFVLVFFQPVLLGTFFLISNTKIPSIALGYRDFVLLFFLTSLTLKTLTSNKTSWPPPKQELIYMILFGAYLSILAAFSPAPIFAKAASIKQLLIPFVLLFYGILLAKCGLRYVDGLKTLIPIGLVLVLVGIIERFYIPSFYTTMNIHKIFISKGILLSKENLPYMFYEPTFGGIRRMAGPVADPINFGHLCATLLVLTLFTKNFQGLIKVIIGSFFFAGLALSFSKGAVLFLAITIMLIYWTNRNWIAIIASASGLIALAPLVVLSMSSHQGILLHILGLLNSIHTASFFGTGVAMAGNYAALYSENLISVGDSYWGSIIGQIGVLGFALWMATFLKASGVSLNRKERSEFNVIDACFYSNLLVSAVSENAFNLPSIFAVTVLLGIKKGTSITTLSK